MISVRVKVRDSVIVKTGVWKRDLVNKTMLEVSMV